jgi:hypothetical protein
MSDSARPRQFFIGWDVGGWNCDRNNKSRDAVVILDESRAIVGKPWRGNLRKQINAPGGFLPADALTNRNQ